MPQRTPFAILLSGLVVSGLVVATPSGPAQAAARKPPVTRTVVRGLDVDRTTIPRLQRAMNHHRLSSVQLTRFYLARIQRLNPRLHAVITTSRTALADAAAADTARSKGVR